MFPGATTVDYIIRLQVDGAIASARFFLENENEGQTTVKDVNTSSSAYEMLWQLVRMRLTINVFEEREVQYNVANESEIARAVVLGKQLSPTAILSTWAREGV